MNLEVDLAGLELEYPLMNAAGTCKVLDGSEGVKELARSSVSAVMVGSITFEERLGNEGDTYYSDEAFSLNSLGLPNPGESYYRGHLPEKVFSQLLSEFVDLTSG